MPKNKKKGKIREATAQSEDDLLADVRSEAAA
jgi:hypothetical protein